MFVIKQNRKQKYLQRNEDNISIAFNLVNGLNFATTFETQRQAIETRDEAVKNAREEIKRLQESNEPLADLDIESISEQYLTLIVTESK